MKRKIIEINEDKCTGCGQCIPGCPEGALQVIDGKARLVSDLFCDGLGACIGNCPEGAMKVTEREAAPYDEAQVMANIVKAGANTVKAHLQHLKEHGEQKLLAEAIAYLKENNFDVPQLDLPHAGGCPGIMMKDRRNEAPAGNTPAAGTVASELRQWPVQLKLLSPLAPYFENANLMIAADCVPFTYADFHRRFLKGKVLIVFCPKLDQAYEQYVEKLTAILTSHEIKSITMVRMEVPCCGGVVQTVEEAVKRSGKQVLMKEYTISLRGEII